MLPQGSDFGPCRRRLPLRARSRSGSAFAGCAVAQARLQSLIEEVLLSVPALLLLYAHRISRSCSLAVEFGPSSSRTNTASADFSFGVTECCHPPARIAPRPKEISQGKTLNFRSVAAGFTFARVCLAFGRPHPMLGYPTALAFYPVPVRQLRALLPASSPPHLTTTQLPSAIGSGQSARRGLPPPTSTSCLAHIKKGGTRPPFSATI